MAKTGTSGESAADAVLLDAARNGSREAFGELWRRHAAAGTVFARYASSTFDADDLVAEAYTRIFRAVTAGGGPAGAFRSYLYATIRNTAHSWQRAHHYTQPLAEAQEALPDQHTAEALEALDGSPSVDAYNSLPATWQEVLWYVDIEGMSATEVAPLLGIAPNAVAARTYRAREGLRQAWIQAQLNTVADGSEHQWVLERMGRFVRNGLPRSERTRLQTHLNGCATCSLVHTEAQQISSQLALSVAGSVLGLSGAALTGWLTLHPASPAEAAPPAATAVSGTRESTSAARRAAIIAGGVVIGAGLAALITWTVIASAPETPAVHTFAPPAETSSPSPNTTTTPRPSETPTPAPTPAPTSSASPPPPATPVAPAALALPVVTAPLPGLVTNVTLLPMTGTGTPGSTITVNAGTTQIGYTSTTQDGTWALTADTSTLGDGPATLTITSARATAAPTTSTITIVIDRHVAIPANLTATTSGEGVMITGTADPGSEVHVHGTGTDVTATTNAAGEWATAPIATFPPGYSTATATATDTAGNTSPPSAPLGIHRP